MTRARIPLDRMPAWPRYLLLAEAAAYVRVSEADFLAEVKLGWWPAPRKRGSKRPVDTWDRHALDRASDADSGFHLAGPMETADSVAEFRGKFRGAAKKRRPETGRENAH